MRAELTSCVSCPRPSFTRLQEVIAKIIQPPPCGPADSDSPTRIEPLGDFGGSWAEDEGGVISLPSVITAESLDEDGEDVDVQESDEEEEGEEGEEEGEDKGEQEQEEEQAWGDPPPFSLHQI